MTEEQWPRVKELFHAALEHPTTSRSAFLTETCGGDETLQAEVERLLAAHDQAGAFIEASPVSGILHAIPEVTAGLSGRVLGHYEVRRLIGCGGMGEVYEARDTELGRTVALKVVIGGSSDAQAALRHEAQHASKLNHPHVCTIHEVGAADGQAFIVMEYVEGQPLNELIEPDGLSIETTLRYGVQISDALAHAHSQDVIHRDLKSANVVVTPDGRAKVLDFGLARVSTSPDDGRVAGTLSCMAPELLRGAAADEQTDVWALGVLLYEMAAGRAPFSAGNAFERSAAILTSPPGPLPAQVPSALQSVIQRCLAKDRRERYGKASDVRSALEAVATEISNGTWQTLAGTALIRAITPLRAAAIVGLLATAVGVGALLRTRSRTRQPTGCARCLGTTGHCSHVVRQRWWRSRDRVALEGRASHAADRPGPDSRPGRRRACSDFRTRWMHRVRCIWIPSTVARCRRSQRGLGPVPSSSARSSTREVTCASTRSSKTWRPVACCWPRASSARTCSRWWISCRRESVQQNRIRWRHECARRRRCLDGIARGLQAVFARQRRESQRQK